MIKIACHLGLGDMICISPIVARLSLLNKGKEIYLPCLKNNISSVKSFYIHYENIKIYEFINEDDFNDATFRLGQYEIGDSTYQSGEDFVSWFYRQADMTFNQIPEFNPLPFAAKCIEGIVPRETCFVHDDSTRNFIINKKGYRPLCDNSKSILRFANVLKTAENIDCIDSSFFHLVNLLPTIGNLSYHRHVRKTESNNFKLTKNWKVLQ